MVKIVNNNLSRKYSKETILIHWISFLPIVLLIPTGFIMSNMETGVIRLNLLKLHMIIGIMIFVLTLIRIRLFFCSKRPSKLETGSSLHNKLVVYIENSFYFVLIFLCISGILSIILSSLGYGLMNNLYTDARRFE